jgi:1-acyl-sn-glycerol-3-phosphate acyltransferase
LVTAPTVLAFRLRCRGRGHVPQTGPCLIAANHQSFLDPVLFGVAAPRALHYMARESLFRVGPFAALIRSVNAHPIRREAADREALRTMKGLLGAGEAVLVFPEGTRTRDGRLGPVKRGIGAVAARTGAPLVPACVSGAFRAWPRQRAVPSLRPVQVRFAAPIRADAADGGREAVGRLRGEWERMLEAMARTSC